MKDLSNYSIVTNNPSVRDNYEDIIFVEGGFREVLLKVRDLTHSGSELINHPLGASIRMFFSPYRSIIIKNNSRIKNNSSKDNEFHINVIENSIQSYDKQMEERIPDIKNGEDYSLIDKELLDSALNEFNRMYN